MTGDAAERAGAILEIDLGAVVDNWRFLRQRAAPAECAAVVKANAYGLGIKEVAPALLAAGCRTFFVATLDEGIALRQVLGPCPGSQPEIAVFNGPLPHTAPEFVAHALTPVLNEPGQVAEWQADGGGNPAILHIDTGMSRLGLTAPEFAALLAAPPRIRWRALMSHLACAEDPEHRLNARQRTRFVAALRALGDVAGSLAASCGIFLGPAYHFDLVRPGAALYGVNPQPDGRHRLRPVVRLCGRILQVRQIDSGDSVGYGAAHVMEAPGRVATVAVGYADGWLRSLGHRSCGRLGGVRVPLIGRVSMDLITFDVSAVDQARAQPGMLVELLGEAYTVDDAARDAGTIGYEMLTALGSRYHRVYHQPPLPAADLR
ncbi:MAG: alanine racemase [Thiohalocapsa sp.]